ncbi:hypothetical protein CDA63_09600 [Hymenobacter amundsenii]|uniref:Uncharacterized protein n=1 Tax=Hymenobacter amundsenii TaxID=2006685 RepID=A0A2D0AG22_9BACT|nr:hypothetical protein [Hymenobacter amundsenii]OWP63271.1 hypothetical protein CDA63_09600 [Hymenobacter amundsenii]
MKKFLLPLLLALAGAPAFAQGPVPHAQPDKNDDTIVLTLPDEGDVAWQRAAAVLVARGYTFRYSDADLLALSTDYSEFTLTSNISIFVLVQGHRLLLRGRCLTGLTPPSNAQAIRRGGFLGGTSNDWTELEAVAQLLGGTAAYYDSAAR